MILNIRLQHFRSYNDESFEFEPGVNIIVGPNGSGKTNLLESILVSSVGGSYRVDDLDLIQDEQQWSRIDAQFENQSRTIKLEPIDTRVRKSYVFDDKPYKILNHQHIFPVVLFEPNHLSLLHSQPDGRRLYIDNLLEQLVPTFKMTRKHYRRVLSQRNALLKSPNRPSKDQFFVWNIRLSELGGEIAKRRSELINDIGLVLPELYQNIADSKSKKVSIGYESKLPLAQYESAFLQALEKTFEQDLVRGFTTYGPHRDDWMVYFDGRPVSAVASRGETRTVVLAIKIYELTALEKARGLLPLLLLDDVFSELDGRRRHTLTDYLKKYQTFITTTDADVVVQNFLDECRIIPLS